MPSLREKILLGLILVCSGPSTRAEEISTSLQVVRPRAEETIEVDGEKWISVLFHLHTVTGQWTYEAGREEEADEPVRLESIERLLRRTHRAGADSIVLTEHNTMRHAQLNATRTVRPGRESLLVVGTEYSGLDGPHLGLLYRPRDAKDCIRPFDPRNVEREEVVRAIRAVHLRDGFVVVNHPLAKRFPWHDPTLLGADAVEIMNPITPKLRGSIDFWHRSLRREKRPIVPISGCDFHQVGPTPLLPFRSFVNRIRVTEKSPAAVRRAFAGGHVLASRAAPWRQFDSLPVIYLAAREGRAGDLIEIGDGAVRVRIRVLGGQGCRLVLYDETSDSPRYSRDLAKSDEMVVLSKRFTGGWGFVRAELTTRIGYQHTVSSPIYFKRR